MNSQRVNLPLWLSARRVVRNLLRPVLYLAVGFRIDSADRLPSRRRPLMLACNHAGFADSIYLTVAVRPRFVVCGAKPRLFRNALLRGLMALGNVLRVESPEQFVGDSAALLEAGEILLVYPEMGRNPEAMGRFEPWAAEVALRARAPILPCFLSGTYRHQTGPPRLVVGTEIDPSGSADKLTQEIREAILELAPPSAPSPGSA